MSKMAEVQKKLKDKEIELNVLDKESTINKCIFLKGKWLIKKSNYLKKYKKI